MEIRILPGTFIFMVINFLLLMFVLVRLLYRPIQGILEQRKKKISDDLGAAEKSRADWERMQQDAKTSLEKAQIEAFEMVDRARSEADKLREDIINQAHREAEEIRAKTQMDIERAKQTAREEIREGAVNLALTAAAKVIGSQMTQQINESLVRGVLDSIEKGADGHAAPRGV